MTSASDRRAFLRTLAAGAAYAAPFIASVAAPVDLMGQGKSSAHKQPGPAAATSQQRASPPPPWEAPPPGR